MEIMNYKEIFYKAPIAIVIIDTEGTILDASLAFIELFKYEKFELIGKNLDYLITTPDCREEAINLTKKVMDTQVEFETIRYDKYKNPIDVATLGKTFKDNQNRTLIFVTYKKITEKILQEKKLQMQRDIIKLINKIMRHDLMNYFSILRSAFRIYNETKEEELLKEAQFQVEKGIKLIKSLKSFEQFESEIENFRQVDVKSEIEKIAESFFNIKIEVKGNISLKIDKTFSRIIENLINNSIKHGQATRIEIELKEENNDKVIIFKDNGIGIPDKIKNVIFQEGFSYGKSGNTGLGLYIVKKLVEIFNGEIKVKDNKPTGAIFEIRFHQ